MKTCLHEREQRPIYYFTWNVSSLVPQAVDHPREVLLVSSFCQSEDDLHEVSVHQSTVCTFCCLQRLTKGGTKNREAKKKKIKQAAHKTSFGFFFPVSFHMKQPREHTHLVKAVHVPLLCIDVKQGDIGVRAGVNPCTFHHTQDVLGTLNVPKTAGLGNY